MVLARRRHGWCTPRRSVRGIYSPSMRRIRAGCSDRGVRLERSSLAPVAFAAGTDRTSHSHRPRRRSRPTGRARGCAAAKPARRSRPRRSPSSNRRDAAPRPAKSPGSISGSTRRAAIRTAPTARSSSRSGAPGRRRLRLLRAPRSARRAAAWFGPRVIACSIRASLEPATRPIGSSCPATTGGRKPFGEWPATSLATTPQWKGTGALDGGDSAFDFGAATVASHNGQAASRNGSVRGGSRSTSAATRSTRAFGYPAESPHPSSTAGTCSDAGPRSRRRRAASARRRRSGSPAT